MIRIMQVSCERRLFFLSIGRYINHICLQFKRYCTNFAEYYKKYENTYFKRAQFKFVG